MNKGVERAPVYPVMPEEPWTDRHDESVMSFQLVQEHSEWISSLLGLETDNPYRVSREDLDLRRQKILSDKEVGHFTARSVYELGRRVLASVAQMEGEFRNQTVLDIGAGQGRFGEAMARNAKARVTFLDNDPEVLKQVSPRAGEVVVADGRDLPFDDESFDKVLCAFSTLHWAATPVESAQAINEALRVVKVGGSAFLIPFLTNMYHRHSDMDKIGKIRGELDAEAKTVLQFIKLTALQDHILINTIFKLAEEGCLAVTWSDQVSDAGLISLEECSVVVDKLKPIPAEFLQSNLDYAKKFMPLEAEG